MSELPGSEAPQVVSLGPVVPRPRRGRLILALAVAGAALLLLAAVLVPLAVRGEPADLADVAAYGDLSLDHVPGDVDYPQSPPVGGAHADAWLECGVYDVPVRDENAVHDLEHGAVWIAHDPDLAEVDVEALAEVLPQNGIMAPYPGLDAPVVVTVWGRQLALDGVDDPRLELFLERYGNGETAPEQGVSCAGGTTDPQGGDGPTGPDAVAA